MKKCIHGLDQINKQSNIRVDLGATLFSKPTVTVLTQTGNTLFFQLGTSENSTLHSTVIFFKKTQTLMNCEN